MSKAMSRSPIPAHLKAQGDDAARVADSKLVSERLQIAYRDRGRSCGSALSLVDKCIIDNIRRLGAARVLADELADQALKRGLLLNALQSADELFAGRPADADAACTTALRALMQYAGIRSAALEHLAGTVLTAKAIEEEQRFEGRLAGLIEILIKGAGISAEAVYAGRDETAKRLKDHAAAHAKKKGYQWARRIAKKKDSPPDGTGKMRGVHTRIAASIDWELALGSIADPQRNIELMPLSGRALDEHYVARLEVMGLWLQARQDVIGPSARSVRKLDAVRSDLKRWVEDRASFYFSTTPVEPGGGKQFYAAVEATRHLHKK